MTKLAINMKSAFFFLSSSSSSISKRPNMQNENLIVENSKRIKIQVLKLKMHAS